VLRLRDVDLDDRKLGDRCPVVNVITHRYQERV
jgi:hypothetical protein